MHPLVAVGLVSLTGPAWMVTVLTLLIAMAEGRRPTNEAHRADQGVEAQAADGEAAWT